VIRFLAVLLVALLLAILIQAVAYVAVLRHELGEQFQLWFGNGCFVLVLALIVAVHRKVQVTGARALAAAAGFILLNLAGLWLAMLLLAQRIFLGLLLTAPVSTIGYYPDGSDAAPIGASAIWAASMLVPVALGAAIGLALRGLLPRPERAPARV
jgi:hypothetical protein